MAFKKHIFILEWPCFVCSWSGFCVFNWKKLTINPEAVHNILVKDAGRLRTASVLWRICSCYQLPWHEEQKWEKLLYFL